MNSLRIGVIGLGMGASYARRLSEGQIARATLGAVCDANPERLALFPRSPQYRCSEDLIGSGAVDAVIVATPHYSHPEIAIDALDGGLHVLVEKPLAVHKAEAERLLRAARGKRTRLAVMLNMRTDPRYQHIRDLVQKGALGKLQRVTWIVTEWFRTQAYYDASTWRGTWAGEGGGLLLNQCPHHLDLLQWMVGMPRTVRAWCGFGKHHRIEVEDEVTAYLEFPGGATGVFVASTAEAPGVNRLEVTGEGGRLLLEGDRFERVRNDPPAGDVLRTATRPFDKPVATSETVPVSGRGGQHAELLQNFVDAALDGVPLIAPGEDGLASVELANAMLLSSVRETTVTLPVDGADMAALLAELIAGAEMRHPAGKAETR